MGRRTWSQIKADDAEQMLDLWATNSFTGAQIVLIIKTLNGRTYTIPQFRSLIQKARQDYKDPRAIRKTNAVYGA